jgi:basic amino acid/polyamine antiporter, APA family
LKNSSSPNAISAGPGLTRALGLLDCILLVVGAIIGSGIFLTPSSIARLTGSVTGLLFVWIAGGVLTFCGALAYAELGSAYPRAGGIYVFLREAYGPLTAFLYGWCNFFVIVAGSIATLASAFAIYLRYLVPIGAVAANLVAVALITALSLANCLGVRAGARVQNVLTFVKIGSLIAMAVALFTSGHGAASHAQAAAPGMGAVPWSSMGIAMVAVLWAYEGWHLLTFAAGEVKNPKRNLTLGLLAGTLLVMALYITINLAYLYVLPLTSIAASSRVASDALEAAIGPAGGTAVAIAILISITGAVNSNVLGGPRVFYAMAQEGLFFKRVAFIHPKYHVPTVSIVLNGVWAAFLTMVGSFERLFSYVIFVAWIFYALGAAAVIVLRRTQPDVPRPYRTWGYPWVPVLFCVIAAAIVTNTMVNDFKNSFWGLLVVLTGLPAYFFWSRKTR